MKIRLQKAHLLKSALRGHSGGPSDRNKKPFRGTQRALRGTQRALRSTQRALRGHSEGTQRALRGTQRALRSTQRALRGTHEGRSVEGAERHRCSVFASSARCASSFRVYNLDAILSFLSRSLSISSASR